VRQICTVCIEIVQKSYYEVRAAAGSEVFIFYTVSLLLLQRLNYNEHTAEIKGAIFTPNAMLLLLLLL
jgi:hypothetical protein